MSDVKGECKFDQPVFAVFGYGSLLWKQGFEFSTKKAGYIKGFQRKFWQENRTHRGTEEKPGRVAIIHEADENEKLWGFMFIIEGLSNIEDAKQKLNHRETVLGGYISFETPFFDESNDESNVLVFTATKESHLYVGPVSDNPNDDVEHIADQVVGAEGHAGTNSEYVIKMAHCVRQFFPEEHDDHLILLDQKVKEKLRNHSKSISTFYEEKDSFHLSI